MDEKGKKEVLTHLKEHQTYPATKADIIAACNYLEHVPADARTWVQNHARRPHLQFGG